jgi:hypothetical protein
LEAGRFPKIENARDLAASGVFRVPHSSSDQTPSGVHDDESSIAAILFRLPAKLSMPLPISFGSRIIGQAVDVIPRRRSSTAFAARRSALLPSSFRDLAYDRSRGRRLHSRAASAPPARLSFQLPSSFGRFVPALDSWTKSPLSDERFHLSQAGEVTLNFRSGSLVFDRSR